MWMVGDFIFISPSPGSAICQVKNNRIWFAFHLGSQVLDSFQLLPHWGHRHTFDAIWREEKYRWSIVFYNLLSGFIPCYWVGSWWIKLAVWIFVKPQYIELGAVQRWEESKEKKGELKCSVLEQTSSCQRGLGHWRKGAHWPLVRGKIVCGVST